MSIIIVGAGGHGQVVADILLLRNGDRVIGFVDDDPGTHGARYLGVPVLGSLSCLKWTDHDGIVVAVGDNDVRARLTEQLAARGEKLIAAVHPSAQVAGGVLIEDGAMLCAGAVVSTGTRIGRSVIVNTSATVDHHSDVDDYAHVAPGVHIGGEVRVGAGALIGIGATVLPRIRIGAYATVGGGAVVIRHVPDRACVVGVPARALAGAWS